MRVRVQAGSVILNKPIDIPEVVSLVVYDDYNQPVAVVQRMDNDQIFVSTAKDPKFKDILSALGVGLNYSVQTLDI